MTRRQYYVALAVLAVTGFMGGGLVSCLTPAKIVSAQKEVPDVVTAHEFRVLDDKGRIGASLKATDEGGVLFLGGPCGVILDAVSGLTLVDAASKSMVRLDVEDGTPSLGLFDGEGLTAAAILSVKERGPGLALYDAAGQNRVALAMTKDAGAGLGLYDEKGQASMVLSVPGPGQSMLGLYDDQNVCRVRLQVLQDQSMIAAVDGNPRLEFNDTKGETAAAISLWDDKLHTVGSW